jgi:DNA-binding NarL/FixJ family response regulator
MNDPITILLVDAHSGVRLGLKAYFATLPDLHVIGDPRGGVIVFA